MTLQLHDKLCGFTVTRVVPMQTLKATMVQMEHDKTGAELVWMDRPDVNKTFCVGFETIPEDDTGVFHIIEHSVLCGSEHFPVKDPFVELMKGSLNTFLNAMTFPDKTMYPVSSRNDRDFLNLMRVYLDAVFFPNIYRNPNIFRQEGWHCELDEAGRANRVGVVYGEMKGAFSSVDTVVYNELNRMLFPDNCYRFVSGGDPARIPELTYEQFLASHRRFYHPSNAKIFLDGEVDLQAALTQIDSYLSRFERTQKAPEIPLQKAVQPDRKTICYEIAPDADKEGKAIFCLGKIVSSWQDVTKTAAAQVLADALAGSDSAPVTRAVLEQGLGKDLRLEVEDGVAQPTYYLQVRDCREDQLSGMKEALQAIFRRIRAEGLNKADLTASLNRLAFNSMERREPYGVELAIRADNAWLYGGNPELYLDLGPVFDELREKIRGDYFENLMEELFLDDAGQCALLVLPSNTLGKEKAEAEQAALADLSQRLTEGEKHAIREAQKELAAWQKDEDTPEARATIPHLNRSDLSEEPLWTEWQTENRGSAVVIRPDIATSGTCYLNLYFALPPMPVEKLSAVSLLTALLGELATRRSSREDLQRAVKTWIGSLDFSVVPAAKVGDPNHADCYLVASCSILEQNAARAVSLLREILLETKLDDADAVREIVQQSWLEAQQRIIRMGHRYAFQHAISGSSAESAATDAVSSCGYYSYLRRLAESFDYEALRGDIAPILEQLPGLPLTLGVTGRLEDALLDELTAGLGGPKAGPTVTLETPHSVRDSVAIPAGVAYCGFGGNLDRLGAAYHGSDALAAKIISLNYLWNEIRMQGGAYGAGMGVSPYGMLFCYSYRDPNPARSMSVYRGCAEYLRKFCESGASFDQMLIGTVSDSEPVLSPDRQSRQVIERALRGDSLDLRRRLRRELLSADNADLLRFCDLLDRLDQKAGTCVIGGANLLDACGDLTGTRLD